MKKVRLLTARALTCSTKTLTLNEISSQLFPPINSLVHDSEAVVRAEMAKTIALLARRVNQSTDSESDLEKRSQKLTLQLMVDADSAVIESIVREMVEVVIEHDGTFREDFFIPQIGK